MINLAELSLMVIKTHRVRSLLSLLAFEAITSESIFDKLGHNVDQRLG